MKHVEHVQALAAELEKTPPNRNAAVLEAVQRDLSQMTDEDIQMMMTLVPPPSERSASTVDREYLRRAVGVGVAMAGERTLDRVMEIYERENIFLVREPMLRDLIALQISWFFDVLWNWAQEKGHKLQPTAVKLLRDEPNGRAYVVAHTLKLWEAATTTENKLAAMSRMADFGLPEFLDPIGAALDEPALVIPAMTALKKNCSSLWTATSNRADMQKKALLTRKLQDVYKTTAEHKTRDLAKETYFALITHAQDVDAIFTNAKQILERADTEEARRVLFLYVLGQLYKDRGLNDDQMTEIKRLVEEAEKHSHEGVKNEAQAVMKIIARRDDPPKYATPEWVNQR